MSQNSRRALTEGEKFILKQIQDMYGDQNTEEDVFASDNGEAVIFIKDRNGTQGLVAVLTNLSSMYQEGIIPSIESLRNEWLCPP